MTSDGLWPGRCSAVSDRPANCSTLPSCNGRSTSPLEPNARYAAAPTLSAVARFSGTPWRRIKVIANASSAAAAAEKWRR